MRMKTEKYLGIDWGEKRIGLAFADGELNLALPYRTVANISELSALIVETKISIIVLGQPAKMTGAQADNPRWLHFLEQLKLRVSCPIKLVDERLTSLAADALLGAPKDKASRDEIAATLILQSYLDKL